MLVPARLLLPLTHLYGGRLGFPPTTLSFSLLVQAARSSTPDYVLLLLPRFTLSPFQLGSRPGPGSALFAWIRVTGAVQVLALPDLTTLARSVPAPVRHLGWCLISTSSPFAGPVRRSIRDTVGLGSAGHSSSFFNMFFFHENNWCIMKNYYESTVIHIKNIILLI